MLTSILHVFKKKTSILHVTHLFGFNDCKRNIVQSQGRDRSNDNHKEELQNLERQLEHAIMEKNKLQVDFNLTFLSVIVD